ncbi:MAG: DUF2779 domain-containing protein [Lachnospiraceae bacterium]|nr:DUF2779 domain-containing protein [Lachnospiraceae bacterium]
MPLFLSKSQFCSAVQCPKMLWLRKRCPELFDNSVMDEHVLETGSKVGDAAMGLFGPFKEVPFGDLSGMIEETKRLMDAGEVNIAEASFSCNGLFCSVDIMRNLGAGSVEIYEVKSSTAIHDIYYYDAAYQNYVLTMLGLSVEKVSIIHIDPGYVRGKELDLHGLFHIEDVTARVRGMMPEVAEKIVHLEIYLSTECEPEMALGEQCFKPYGCGFWGHCSEMLPVPNVFDVSSMQLRKKLECYNEGAVSFADLEDRKSLNDGQRMQIVHELHDMLAEIDRAQIRKFLGKLSYPLYFLDFETFQPAIPLYENTRPYEQIVFQYSLHFIEEEGAPLKHREYLAWPGEDPRRKLAEQLCRDIPEGVTTLAYNMAFEKGRIRSLAALYPDLAAHLMDIHDHMCDLMVPFQKKWYYNRAMQGSYSIKYVLPALFPEDPALNYKNLDGVHNGAEASAAFEAMEEMPRETLLAYREYLLKYCGLDTFAMVRIWEHLQKTAQGGGK